MVNTKKKRKDDPPTRFARTVQCPVQIACDGVTLMGRRVDKGLCPKCEAAKLKRNKVIPPRGLKA